MIVTRTPLRITLGGGGSDLDTGGVCITAAINVYVYIVANNNYSGEYLLKYGNQVEHVKDVESISHDLIRGCLEVAHRGTGIELVSMGDVPGGSGLGSSAAFTVGTLRALGFGIQDAAEVACTLDTGYQDQWACAQGGLRKITEHISTEIHVSNKTKGALADCLRLYDTGILHDAKKVLKENARPPRETLIRQANDSYDALMAGDMRKFAGGLTAQWTSKFLAAPTPQHADIQYQISKMLEDGAWGAKLIGAGNGGFILAYTEHELDTGMREIPFEIDWKGSVVL